MRYEPSPYQLPGLLRQARRNDSPAFAIISTIIVGYILYKMANDLTNALNVQHER